MANVVGNNNNNNGAGNALYDNVMAAAAVSGARAAAAPAPVHTMRDISRHLQQPPRLMDRLRPDQSPYDHIVEMMRDMKLHDDGIAMNHKIKSIEMDFCSIVQDKDMLCESMEYINDKALNDRDTALKFAILFSSRSFDVLAMEDIKVRSAMLKILETNYLNADTYRQQDKIRLYNSIALLGEYYFRVRLADNSPITILGESLLGLLIREISEVQIISEDLAKLIVSQVTLNGTNLRVKHKAEMAQLLFLVRRNLIEQPSQKLIVKALLLMTLDLYYNNFNSLDRDLETWYTNILMHEDESESNNNAAAQQQQHQQQAQPPQAQHNSPAQGHNTIYSEAYNTTYENGEHSSHHNDSYEAPLSSGKKWSEEVSEEAFFELEFGANDADLDRSRSENSQYSPEKARPSGNREDKNSKRSQQPRNTPRPLKLNQKGRGDDNNTNKFAKPHAYSEERDETKPLPRWRETRFNREAANGPQQQQRQFQQQRRFSASYDDDHHSVHSDGGSMRLYTINDRLKHSQEKIERSNGTNYNSLAYSNWDRSSQHDDRSERSYASNYERGNHRQGGGGRQYNNRHTYDKPPRFQKFQQQQEHQQQQQNQHHHQHNKGNRKIHSDSWRRSRTYSNSSNPRDQEEHTTGGGEPYNQTNGPESNSRSSSRARTLPRPGKTPIDGNQHYRREPRDQRGRSYNNTARYSSQSSLASEESSALDRRHHQRNRNFARRNQQQNQEQHHEEENWENEVYNPTTEVPASNSSELVSEARQTTKYMNYLSAQK